MKKRVVFLLTGLFIWTSVLLAQNVSEGVIGAFKEGSSQELNKYLGDKVDLIIQNKSTTPTSGRQRAQWLLSSPTTRLAVLM